MEKRKKKKKEKKMIKNILQVSSSLIGVCCYIITSNPEYLILIAVDDICHEDMTGKRGENVTG